MNAILNNTTTPKARKIIESIGTAQPCQAPNARCTATRRAASAASAATVAAAASQWVRSSPRCRAVKHMATIANLAARQSWAHGCPGITAGPKHTADTVHMATLENLGTCSPQPKIGLGRW